MSDEKRVDRLYIDKDDIDDYERLKKEKGSPFYGSDNKEIFLAAMVTGFNEGSRIPLKKREGYFRDEYLRGDRKLLNALAVYEEKNLNILLNKAEVFKIAEEYASGGIKILINKINSGDFGSFSKKTEDILLTKYKTALLPVFTQTQKTLEFKDFEDINTTDLLQKNESEFLELKAGLLWDYHQQKGNPQISLAIVRIISSFMNSHGGIMLIGIDDKKVVLGLENDMKLLKGQDGFERHLTSIIDRNLGITYRKLIKLNFESVDEKEIAKIKISKSPRPVFFTDGDKKDFYIRTGNSSQPLDISEITNYKRDNWPKTI